MSAEGRDASLLANFFFVHLLFAFESCCMYGIVRTWSNHHNQK